MVQLAAKAKTESEEPMASQRAQNERPRIAFLLGDCTGIGP